MSPATRSDTQWLPTYSESTQVRAVSVAARATSRSEYRCGA